MLSFPLGVSLNKDKVFIFHDGKIDILNSPKLDLVLPSEWIMKSNIKIPGTKILEDKHYFIGADKYDMGAGTSAETNLSLPAATVPTNHEQWVDGVGSRLPFSYTDYMLLTKADKLRQWSHTRDLRIMYFDIETASDGTGMFSKPSRNPIAMFGIKFNYELPSQILAGTQHHDMGDGVYIFDGYDMSKSGIEDKQILLDLSHIIGEMDPDVIVSYNGWKFDLPYILVRMQKLGLDSHQLQGIPEQLCDSCKNMRSYYMHNNDPENTIQLGLYGKRVHYDIFNVDVLRDQKLTGKVKNKKMKTVAAYFYPEDKNIVTLDEPEMENIAGMMESKEGRETLRTYLKSDIIQTERLSDIYFESNNVRQAELLQVPLATMVNRRSGTIPTLHLLREVLKEKMMPLATNTAVFEKIIRRTEEEFKEKKFFQGAYVDILKRGKIPRPIYKVDFSSLYPNIIRTFNLSYETVKIRFSPLREESKCQEHTEYPGETIVPKIDDSPPSYRVVKDHNDLVIKYNDKVLHCRVTVRIDMSKRGLIPRVLDRLLSDRETIKKSIEGIDTHSVEYKKKDSEQNFCKVVSNSVLDFEEVICYNTYMKQIEIMTITELYGKFQSYPDRYLACTSNYKGQIKWSKISKVWRHLLKKGDKVYRVTVKHGSSIIVTEDHSLMLVNKDGLLHSRPTCDIHIGDRVAYARELGEIPTGNNGNISTTFKPNIDKWLIDNGKEPINIYIHEKFKLIYRMNYQKEYVASFIENMDDDYCPIDTSSFSKLKTVKRLLKVGIIEAKKEPKGNCYIRQIYRLTRLGKQAKYIMSKKPEWDKQSKCFKIKNETSINKYRDFAPDIVWGINVKQSNKVDPYPLWITIKTLDEAYALGAYVAEGSIGQTIFKNSYRGMVSQKTGKCDKSRIKKGLDSLFNTKHTIKKDGITINTWYEAMILELMFGKYSYNKTVDINFVNNMSNRVTNEFLDGYFDGDGNLIAKTGLSRYSSTSLELLERVKFMMNKIGRTASLNSFDSGCYRLVETKRGGVTGREVISKEEIQLQEDRYVYDICVPDSETFIMANGIVSHNSLYGILSQRTGIGYLPIGMTVTAMGRWATMNVTNELNKDNSKLIKKS